LIRFMMRLLIRSNTKPERCQLSGFFVDGTL
jgi:hypothetical protein